MCGIFCSTSRRSSVQPSPELQELLGNRGPDSTGERVVAVDGLFVTFYSTVLSLRGDTTVRQPLQKATSDSGLCWNGEAWTIDGQPTLGNDTEQVFDLLLEATRQPTQATTRTEEALARARTISAFNSRIAGPYAFVFYDAGNGMLFFGRDFLGRRSLLTKTTDDGDVIISSVTDAPSSAGWAEIEADGVYCLDLLTETANGSISHGLPRPLSVPYVFAGEVPQASGSVGLSSLPT
jgi:asparagine synthetase B (glutamine-hydrolysing)